jgi:hypothetical protein
MLYHIPSVLDTSEFYWSVSFVFFLSGFKNVGSIDITGDSLFCVAPLCGPNLSKHLTI